jgi:hypothetical protein
MRYELLFKLSHLAASARAKKESSKEAIKAKIMILNEKGALPTQD